MSAVAQDVAALAPSQPTRPELRLYQQDAIGRLRHALVRYPRDGRRVILQAATGAGKTLMAAHMIAGAEQKGVRTLFVVGTLELVDQAVRAFDSYGLRVGVMQAQHERTNETRPTQVCTFQTLRARLKRMGPDRYPVGMIVTDEAHEQSKVRDRLAELYPDAIQIGLTATPFTKGLGRFWREVVCASPIEDLIANGFLSPFRVYGPPGPDMTGCAMSGGDWKMEDAADRYDDELMADVVETWMRHGKGRRTLMFACNVAHSKALVQTFQSAGVNAVHVDGYPEREGDETSRLRRERHEAIAAFRRGEIEILSNVGICTKGFDCPETSCAIIARPTKSLSLHWQIIGRVLRPAPGKTDALILDHSTNHFRLGFVTDDVPFELDDGSPKKSSDKRKDDTPLPIPCPSCSYMKPAGVHKCPACGFAPERQNQVVNVDGELVPLVSRSGGGKGAAKHIKQRWYAELCQVAKSRGYSSGWVAHTYRDYFTVWPSRLEAPSEDVPVSQDVIEFIRAKAEQFKKDAQKAKRIVADVKGVIR